MNPAELLQFLSEDSAKVFIELIDRAHRERGKGWIDSLKLEFPMLQLIFDLLEKDAESAYQQIRQTYPKFPVYVAKSRIIQYHNQVSAEYNRRRFN